MVIYISILRIGIMGEIMNRTMGMVSIIVPVYNTCDYLDKCIKSIVRQTYPNLEIILVDDGSTDGSGDVCEQWKKRDSRIKVIHQKNQGQGAARNSGLLLAAGDYIQFVDSDDYIELDMVEQLIRIMIKEDTDIFICMFKIIYPDRITNVHADQKERVVSGEVALIDYFSGNGAPYLSIVWNKLYKRKIFMNNPIMLFPHSHIYEDEYVSYKMLYRAKKISIIDAPLYCYMQRNGSVMHSAKGYKELLVREKIIREYYRWMQESAPELDKLIEYAGIRIFNGFVWSCVQNQDFEKCKPIISRLNSFILRNTHDLRNNPYLTSKVYKNYLLMKWGLIVRVKQMECWLRR